MSQLESCHSRSPLARDSIHKRKHKVVVTPDLKNDYNSFSKTAQKEIVNRFEKKKSPSRIILIVLASVFVLLVLYLSYKGYISNNDAKKNITFEDLKGDFPESLQTLEMINTIINDVLKAKPIHPAIFLFLHKKNTTHDNFINSIATFASSKLKVKDKYVVADELDYNSPNVIKDYGHLIEKYRPLLETRRVMVIKNINKMSGNVAQALHTFCDEITPLVDRAVYILTLEVDSLEGKNLKIAEKQLFNVWSDLEYDLLTPLIARVTSTVIKIN